MSQRAVVLIVPGNGWKGTVQPRRADSYDVTLKPFLLLPVLAFSAGCATDTRTVPHPLGRTATRVDGEMSMYSVDDNDAQLARANQQARRNVRQFITALQHPQPGQKDFQVKKLFVAKETGKGEHIWLADVHFNGNRFQGVVDNKPVYLTGLKIGAKASVNPDEISDWSYVENGHLVGGYTIRVIYDELSAQDKQDFEKQAGFHIEP